MPVKYAIHEGLLILEPSGTYETQDVIHTFLGSRWWRPGTSTSDSARWARSTAGASASMRRCSAPARKPLSGCGPGAARPTIAEPARRAARHGQLSDDAS